MSPVGWAAWVWLFSGCGWWTVTSPPPRDAGQGPPVVSVELRPEEGQLTEMLVAQHAAAVAQGRAAFVQVYAEWCGPCVALRGSMQDPQMQDAFVGVHLVRLELEPWRGELLRLGDVPQVSVPSFFEVLPDGTLGRSITGHAWGDNVPRYMAPPLADFFRGER